MRVSNLGTCDVRNNPDDVTYGVRDPATGGVLSSTPAVGGDLTELVGAEDGAATDLLCGASDLLAVGLPVRTVGHIANNVADALGELRIGRKDGGEVGEELSDVVCDVGLRGHVAEIRKGRIILARRLVRGVRSPGPRGGGVRREGRRSTATTSAPAAHRDDVDGMLRA